MSLLYQESMIEFLQSYPDNMIMIPIYGHTKQFGTDAFIKSIIAPTEFADDDMCTDDTNHWPSTLLPGFTQYGSGGNENIVYYRYNNDDAIEPFIILREFEGLLLKSSLKLLKNLD